MQIIKPLLAYSFVIGLLALPVNAQQPISTSPGASTASPVLGSPQSFQTPTSATPPGSPASQGAPAPAQTQTLTPPPATVDTPSPAAQPTTISTPARGRVEADADVETLAPATLVPKGTLEPVTLKATLQKKQTVPVGLEDILRLALGQNIEIDLEEERLEQRRLERQFLVTELLPDVRLEYNQQRFNGAIQIFGGETLAVQRTTYQPQVTLNYSIFTGGQNLLQIRASRQRQEAQASLLEDTRQTILSQSANAYYELQQAYWQKALALQAIREAEQQVALNEARLESGVGIRLDVLQAQTLLANRRRDLINSEAAISQASQQLNRLLNFDLDVDIVPKELEATVKPLVPTESDFRTLTASAVQNSPRLAALERLREASETDVKTALASVFPRIDITAFVNGTGPSITELATSRFGGIQVSTTLLDNLGFAYPVRRKQARNLVKLAELAVQQARRELEERLANDWIAIQANEDRVEVAKEAFQFARAAYEQALGRLREGVGTNLDVETAQTRLATARSELATAFLDYNQSQVSLVADLGIASITSLTQGTRPNGSPAAQP